MKQVTLTRLLLLLRYCAAAVLLLTISFFSFSFKARSLAEGLFTQLGISQPNADSKITNSFLGGYLDAYGVKNVKNIAAGNRTAVANNLLQYTKGFVNTELFKKQYAALKESNKPVLNKMQTPDEMQKSLIESSRKSVADMEVTVKKADPSMKKIFEDVLIQSKKALKEAEDPNNKMIASYRKNYESGVKFNQQAYNQQLQNWETEYPANHLLFVKKRLLEFLDETKDIDFSAALTEKNGKKLFTNPAYERKGNRWKMAFRAGKEVVEPARAFVQQWITEIK
jgi:hypothetical protein